MKYTLPSRVRTLVLPGPETTPSEFRSHIYALKKAHEVRLVDVSNPNNQTGPFNPLAFPSGKVIYDFHVSGSSEDTLYLHDFDIWRRTLIVMAIGTRPSNDASESLSKLKKKYPSAIMHAIIFYKQNEQPNDSNNLTNEDEEGMYFVDTNASLGTVMCDITSTFLRELGTLMQSYTPVTIRSPVSVGAVLSHLPPVHSKTGSTSSLGSHDKKQARAKGRLLKITGNCHLLAGLYSLALKTFTEAATQLKSAGDHLWLGSAIDGIALSMVLLRHVDAPFQVPSILSGSHNNGIAGILTPISSPRNSMSSPIGDIRERPVVEVDLLEVIPDITTKALQYYSMSQLQPSDSCPPQVYIDTLLRLSTLLTHSHNYGLDERVLTSMVLDIPLPSSASLSHYYLNQHNKFLTKPYISSLLTQLQNSSSGLDIYSKTNVLSNVAKLYDDLKMERKKAAIIRDLLLSIRKKLGKTKNQHDRSHINNRPEENIGLIKVLYSLADVYKPSTDLGVDNGFSDFYLSTLKSLILVADSIPSPKTTINFICRLFKHAGENLDDEEQLKLYTIFDHSVEALRNQKGKRKVEDSKPNNQVNEFGQDEVEYWDDNFIRDAMIILPEDLLLPAPSSKPPSSSRPNSSRYSNGSPMTSLLSTPRSARTTSDTDSPSIKRASTEGSILFNPFNKEASTNESDIVLTSNEKLEFQLKMLNKMKIDIEIDKIELHTPSKCIIGEEGVTLETIKSKKPYILPANSIIDLKLTVIPKGAGELKIDGVIVKTRGCKESLFKIGSKMILGNGALPEKLKVIGLQQSDTIIADDVITRPNQLIPQYQSKTLSYFIIPPQPLLKLTDITLTHNWLMLLEGEKHVFSISIQNISENIPVNFIELYFNDSTIAPLQLALEKSNSASNTGKDLNNKDFVPLNEVFEIEYFLLMKNSLKWINQNNNGDKRNEIIIKSGSSFKLELETFGKRGMKDATIRIEYGYHDPIYFDSSNDTKKFSKNMERYKNYVRSITVPLNITVNTSVELAGCDLIALKSGYSTTLSNLNGDANKSTISDAQIWKFIHNISAQGKSVADYCLLVIDLRNAWVNELTVILESSNGTFYEDEIDEDDVSTTIEEDIYKIEQTIDPGRTTRFILPIQRIKIPKEQLMKQIPSLRNKQFILDQSSRTEHGNFLRESFWYRKELLRHLRGKWYEKKQNCTIGNVKDMGRSGEVELRGVRLSQNMVNVLQVNDVDIQMTMETTLERQMIVTKLNNNDIYSPTTVTEVVNEESNDTTPVNRGPFWEIKRATFVTIKTKIINNTSRSICGILRHVPGVAPGLSANDSNMNGNANNNNLSSTPAANNNSSNNSLDRQILFNGVLQRIIPPIKPNCTKIIDFGVIFLEKGEYEWGAMFDEIIVPSENSNGITNTPKRFSNGPELIDDYKTPGQFVQREPLAIKVT